uniref:Uncharacterized protein n=1 Tax=Tanacetum cinerariifolium TaxID=118510 RepID=A0A699H009_TANCI|nr:hypothetical protein [Tanacetum cinerariifolium]
MALCTSLQRQQTELVSKFKAQKLKITSLKARIKLLEDKDGGVAEQYRDDAPIKGKSLESGEETGVERTKKGSDDTEEMVNVFTSLDATTILSSGVSVSISLIIEISVAEVPSSGGSVLTASPTVPTGSDVIPTAGLVFTTATMSTPYTRRKGKEKMTQQRKPFSRKKQKEFYMSVLKSHAGWKARYFKGMTLEEIKEKFDPVWKQIKDFIPIGSKEESERFKRKGIRLEQDIAKKLKTSEEVPEEKLKKRMELILVEEVYVKALQVKHAIIDWEVYTERERSYWKIIRLGGSTTSYQFFVDLLKNFDREDLNQLWGLVKEILNIRPAANDKEKELWVELKRLYEPDLEDQLWTHTQNMMHAPVEWKLYNTCGVH